MMSGQNGSPVFSPEVWGSLAERLSLSRREVDVAKLVLKDRKELAIAMDLGISQHTVHTHLERLYRKMGVSSRLELAVRLVQCHHQLVTEPGSALDPICARREAGECPFAD